MSFALIGFGAPAFGSIAGEFNAAALWKDAVAGSPVQYGGKGDNAAGKRATELVQAGLNELGYGPLAVNGAWQGPTIASYDTLRKQFAVPKIGLVDPKGLAIMEQHLKAGSKPGPGPKFDCNRVGGQIVCAPALVTKSPISMKTPSVASILGGGGKPAQQPPAGAGPTPTFQPTSTSSPGEQAHGASVGLWLAAAAAVGVVIVVAVKLRRSPPPARRAA